jgi:hypothetical protein
MRRGPRVNGHPLPSGLQSRSCGGRCVPLRYVLRSEAGRSRAAARRYLRLRFGASTIRTLPPLGLNVLTWPSAQRTS